MESSLPEPLSRLQSSLRPSGECPICMELQDELVPICTICVDGRVCHVCKQEMEQRGFDLCPICRTTLVTDKVVSLQRRSVTKTCITYSSFYGMKLIIETILPIAVYFHKITGAGFFDTMLICLSHVLLQLLWYSPYPYTTDNTSNLVMYFLWCCIAHSITSWTYDEDNFRNAISLHNDPSNKQLQMYTAISTLPILILSVKGILYATWDGLKEMFKTCRAYLYGEYIHETRIHPAPQGNDRPDVFV